jgi:hypothetical protein
VRWRECEFCIEGAIFDETLEVRKLTTAIGVREAYQIVMFTCMYH